MDRLYPLLHEKLFRGRNLRTPVLKNIFRRDIYERAKKVLAVQIKKDDLEAEQFAMEVRGR
jgi:hypothetical protein